MGAGAVRVVERKQARFDFFNGETGDRTGKFGGKSRPLMRGVVFGKDKAVTEFERGLQRLGQPFADFRFNDKTVNHDFYVVFLVFIERRDFFDVINIAVDFQALIPLFLQAFDFFFVFAFFAAGNGREQQEFGSFRHGEDFVHHLRDGLGFNGQSGRRRIGRAGTGPEKTHIIVNFGNGADGRTRVVRRGFLLNRNCRRQTFNRINFGFFHQIQKLACIRRKAFDITALPFGIDGVKREGRLSGAGKAGDDGQFVFGDADVDVFKVVFAGAFDFDKFVGHIS